MDWGEILTQLLVVAITVFVPVLGGLFLIWVRPILKGLDENLANRLGQEQWNLIKTLAEQFVLAAEQQGVWDTMLQEGKDKKKWVFNKLAEQLKQQGIDLDFDAINAAIEAAVFQIDPYAEFSSEPVEEPRTEPVYTFSAVGS